MTWYFHIEISDKTIRIYALDQKMPKPTTTSKDFQTPNPNPKPIKRSSKLPPP
jgi:hypothetical protein